MAGYVEGIRRSPVLGLLLIAGTTIEQAPSVCPHFMYAAPTLWNTLDLDSRLLLDCILIISQTESRRIFI